VSTENALEKFRTLQEFLMQIVTKSTLLTNLNVLCDPNDNFLTLTTSATLLFAQGCSANSILQVACNQYHHPDTLQTLKAGTCLVRAYMVGQKYNKAYEAYQQAVYRDGQNSTFWCSIGVLYFQNPDQPISWYS
jgi:hypothetical protein